MDDMTVATIVAKDYRTSAVFRRNNIDFCCGGNKLLSVACKEQGLDIHKVVCELETARKQPSQDTDIISSLEPDTLIDYIIQIHHSFIRQKSPEIISLLNKIHSVHGKNHPEIEEIKKAFSDLQHDLSEHMEKEEESVFPKIKQLLIAKKKNKKYPFDNDKDVQKSIQELEQEHNGAGKLLKELRKRTNNYNPPADACNTYKTCFFLLEEFEQDIHRHIHLENNILFPKTTAIEEYDNNY